MSPGMAPVKISERHTSYVVIHPYYGYVLKPDSVVDFGLKVPKHFGHDVLIETDRNGFRNSGLPEEKPENEFRIGLFGGSVAFSILSSNNSTTISGYLEQAINAHEVPHGKRARVINLALPGCQQPQQLAIFINHLSCLDGIVTFDGYNEITVPALRNIGKIPDRFPYFPYYYELFVDKPDDERRALIWLLQFIEAKQKSFARATRLFSAPFISRIDKWIRNRLNMIADGHADDFKSLYPVPTKDSGSDLDRVMESGARRWYDHILLMRDMAAARGIKTLFVLQPLPEFGKELTQAERGYLADKEKISRIRTKGYERKDMNA